MYIGKDVTFIDEEGGRHKATVLAITGAGPSTYKILTLGMADGSNVVEKVPHANDAAEGAAHWVLRADPAPKPPPEPAAIDAPAKPKRRAKRKKT